MIDALELAAAVKVAEARAADPADNQQSAAEVQVNTSAAAAWDCKPADLSDSGNAEAFASWVSGKLLHCPALGWLYWDGCRWSLSDISAVDLSMQFSQALLNDALANYAATIKTAEPGGTEEKRAKSYLSHAQKSRSKRSLDAMQALSKAALNVELTDLDADGYKLNTPAGLVDLRTGKIVPHDPAQLCTKITRCEPGEQGVELWQQFLADVTEGDANLQFFLQQVAGMAAVGIVLSETAVFLIGEGRNGKSTFLNALAAVLGDYSGSMDIEVLTTARQNRGAAFAELQGRRLVCAGELEQGARLSVSTLKQLCSTDPIQAERKYKAPSAFVPSHTLVLCSNYFPRVGSNDTGCWRRIQVVPFKADFSGQKERKNYGDYLVKEAGPAILQWSVEGARLFLKNGGRLQIPEVVEDMTDAYKAGEDWLGRFIEDCCSVDNPNVRTQARPLYECYRDYSRTTGDFTRRERDFVAALEARGFSRTNSHGTKFWIGITMNQGSYPAGLYYGSSAV